MFCFVRCFLRFNWEEMVFENNGSQDCCLEGKSKINVEKNFYYIFYWKNLILFFIIRKVFYVIIVENFIVKMLKEIF